MQCMRPRRVWILLGVFTIVSLLLAIGPVGAHAILVESSPAARATLAGPDVPIRLRFNVRVDGTRSRFFLIFPDNASHAIAIEKQASAETLSAKATGLKAGAYVLRWMVLASDGHLTRGELPFNVSAASSASDAHGSDEVAPLQNTRSTNSKRW